MSKINFIVWSPGFSEKVGGSIVLAKLAEILHNLGENSYTTFGKPGSNVKIISENDIYNFDKNNSIIIYPEIVTGNPFSFKHVTRWLLYTPGKHGGDGIYSDNDLIYKYWNYFKAPDESKVNGELRCFDLKIDNFYNKNLNRDGDCHIVRKGAFYHKKLDKHSENSIDIAYYSDDNFLLNIFNEKDMFLSYDSMTYLSIQAALCGCTSVVIPEPNVSKEEWISKCPIFKYGVAYGLEDIDWSIKTKHLVKDHLIELENESIKLVKKFVEDCYKHIFT